MVERLNEQNHDNLEYLQEYVQAVLNDAPAQDWCQRARRRLQDSLESKTKENWMMSLIRNYRQKKLRWAFAMAIVMIGLAMLGILPRSKTSVAFADVVTRIREARTMSFNQIVQMKGVPDLRWKVMFRAPSATRMEMDDGRISIRDLEQKKNLFLIPQAKKCIVTETNPSQEDQERGNLVERLRTLPERATEILPKRDMDGHTVSGFRVAEEGDAITLWADVATGDPVRAEYEAVNAPGIRKVMMDFVINPPLDETLFSVNPPAGYSVEMKKADDNPSAEQDLVNFLRLWATHPKHPDGFFPPSLNPTDLAMPSKEMEADPNKGSMAERMKANAPLYRWSKFVVRMRPENDWNYAGGGVKYGDSSQPICWWKPDGSKTYRVITGDLSVIDVELDSITAGGRPPVPVRR